MSSRFSFTLAILALIVAGCDRQAPDAAQERGSSATDNAGLAGEIDRSRAGALMPAITVRDPDGAELNLGALQGRPVLVNLWATWCAPCVVEMPQLDELAQEMEDDLRVLTVSQDMQGAEAVPRFFAERDFARLEQWLDPNNELAHRMESNVLPTTILYDDMGREVWRIVGEYDWSSATAREAVAEAAIGRN